MLEQTPRTQAWLADLAMIVAEMDAGGRSTSRLPRKRTRKLKPLWEE